MNIKNINMAESTIGFMHLNGTLNEIRGPCIREISRDFVNSSTIAIKAINSHKTMDNNNLFTLQAMARATFFLVHCLTLHTLT